MKLTVLEEAADDCLTVLDNAAGTHVRPLASPRGCTEAVTVWNRYRCPVTGKEELVRHVLPVLCRWRQNVRRSEYRQAMGTAGVSNSLVVIVPACDGYIHYDEWKTLGPDDRRRLFTLHITDLLALGEHTIEISGVAPYTETDVRRLLGERIAIVSSFTDCTRGGRGGHYKLGAFYGLKSRY